MVVSLHLEAECLRGAHPEVHSLQPHAPERKESGMWGGGGGWGAKSSSESNRFPFSAVLALGHMYVTAVAGRGSCTLFKTALSPFRTFLSCLSVCIAQRMPSSHSLYRW